MSTADHGAQQKGARRSLADTLELDKRLFGMVIAFAILCIVFHIATDGKFMTPRNIFNVAVQTVSVGIMATGLVFVIVSRKIDLSVGSMLAICSAIMAVLQTRFLPPIFGLGNPVILPITIAFGLLDGTGIGALTGWMVGFQRIPSFIVTLIGAVASIIAVVAVLNARRGKQRHGFIVKPVWAEGVLIALILGAILGFVLLLNSYEIPTQKLKRLFEARSEVMPDGYVAYHGLPISVMILILVAVTMTVVSQKTRFGRYIFATGGNPDAAELSGINTRFLTVKVFALMEFLCALAGLVAQARLQSHGNDIGTLDELKVIAATVIGGTALAGGIGTIYGALLGALVMQSLQSGMAMVGVVTPFQNIVVGAVLIIAVWIDIFYRKRTGGLK